MALAWLDAARYSDSNGYQQRRTRTLWPWRDWVVEAFNDNMPYDQFTIEQLAGDLLPNPTTSQLVATGFHRNHMLNGEGGRIAEESRVEYVVDRVETTGTVWLGLTAGCARCHDHKFDQLSQKEFYSLFAFFNSVEETGGVDKGGNANPVLPLPTPEQEARRRDLESERTKLQEQLKASSEEQKPEVQKQIDQNKKALDGLNGSIVETMIMRDKKNPRKTYRLNRGQWDQPDESALIPPGVPACFPPLAFRRNREPIGTRPLACLAGSSTHRAGGGQPGLAAFLRHGTCQNHRGLWNPRRTPQPSRTIGLAGDGNLIRILNGN